MSLKKATRTAQTVLEAEFTWNFGDTMVNTVGNTVDFGLTNLGGAAGKFDVINLPPGSVILGGELIVETAFDIAGYDITVGDSSVENRYLASTDAKGLGRTALTPTGFHNTEVLNLPVRTAARMAGMSIAKIAAPHIIQAREVAKKALQGHMAITKEDIVHGYKEAIDMAKILAEPMTMIVGWEKVAKILGL